MQRRHALLFLALVAFGLSYAAVAFAQYQTPIPPDTVSFNAWTPSLATAALHSSVHDGGLSVGAITGTGADTMSAAECQPRLVAYGYDTEQSNIVSTLDRGGWRTAGFGIEWFALGALADGGYTPVTFNQTPLVYATWYRHFAGGADAGQPWVYAGSTSITNSGGPTVSALGRISNTGSFAFDVGLYCFVPLVTGAGVDKVVQRINKDLIYVGAPH